VKTKSSGYGFNMDSAVSDFLFGGEIRRARVPEHFRKHLAKSYPTKPGFH
jgi:hypothetical protein